MLVLGRFGLRIHAFGIDFSTLYCFSIGHLSEGFGGRSLAGMEALKVGQALFVALECVAESTAGAIGSMLALFPRCLSLFLSTSCFDAGKRLVAIEGVSSTVILGVLKLQARATGATSNGL